MFTKQKLHTGGARESKNTDFACLAHDLKTPISAQIRIIDLILENSFGGITRAQREVLLELRNSCEYMRNLVQNIVSAYSLENNRSYLRKDIFNVRDVISETISELSFLSEEKHQFLTYITESKSSWLMGDKIQIKRCMVNLVSNAITYSPKNSEIIIKSDKSQNEFIFSVTNKSSYLLPCDLEGCFDKFRSGNLYGSSGLGLYVVKKIILAHDGRVFVKRNNNNSCTFGFKMPVLN